MNKTIKFRAWVISAQQLFKWTDIECIKSDGTWNSHKEGCFDSNDSILMQYIGTTDKHGVEIYEGDILTFCKGGVRKVVFVDCAFACQDVNGGIYWSTEGFLKNESEIIGNIFENRFLFL